MFVPTLVIGSNDEEFRNQMLDNEIERLTMQRDEKYAELQKCEKSTKGFKIAGITTLVATGVGVYGNIKLSQKIKGKKAIVSSGGGLNAKVLTADESQKQMCDDDCGEGNYTPEQCVAYDKCWKDNRTDCQC